MQPIISTTQVHLAQELAELDLHRGEVGIVRKSWHYPTVAYEVEFHGDGQPVRVLLLDYQISIPKEQVR